MKENIAVVLAGGSGKRMGSEIPKQYLKLNDKEIFIHSLEIFDNSNFMDRLILVISKEEEQNVKDILKKYTFKKPINFAYGGRERYFSVYSALELIKEKFDAKIVAIHDAARPLMKTKLIDSAIENNIDLISLVFATKSKDTLRRVKNGIFVETIDREEIYNIQTPQIFDFNTIKKAYDILIKNENLQRGITDDAGVLKICLDIDSALADGDYENIKITTKEDLAVAEIFLRKRI